MRHGGMANLPPMALMTRTANYFEWRKFFALISARFLYPITTSFSLAAQ